MGLYHESVFVNIILLRVYVYFIDSFKVDSMGEYISTIAEIFGQFEAIHLQYCRI